MAHVWPALRRLLPCHADYANLGSSWRGDVLAGITVFVWVFESTFEYLYAVRWRNLAQNLQHDLRMESYAHVQKLELSWFERTRTGTLMSVLNDDINQMERFLNGGANNLIQVATTIVAVGGVFFFLSPLIALLAFAPIPVVILGAFWFQNRAMPEIAPVAVTEYWATNQFGRSNWSRIRPSSSATTSTFRLHELPQSSLT